MKLNNGTYVRLKSLFHQWSNSTRIVLNHWECAHVAAMIEFSSENSLNANFLGWPIAEIHDFGEFDPWFKFDESKLRKCIEELQNAAVLDSHCRIIPPVDAPTAFDHYMATHDLILVHLNRRRMNSLSERNIEFPFTDDEKDAWSYFVSPANLEIFKYFSRHALHAESSKLLEKAFRECKANAKRAELVQVDLDGTQLTCP